MVLLYAIDSCTLLGSLSLDPIDTGLVEFLNFC